MSVILTLLCGAGILVSWVPQELIWYSFEIAVYAILAVWLIFWTLGKAPEARWHWLLALLPAVVAVGVAQIGLHWTEYAWATKIDVLRWGAFAAIFLLAFQTAGSDHGYVVRRIGGLIGFGLIVISMLERFGTPDHYIFWIFPMDAPTHIGPYLNKDHFCTFAMLIMPMIAMSVSRSQHKYLFPLVCAVIYAAVIAAVSRAGFVLITVELVALAVILRTSVRSAVLMVGLAAMLAAVVGVGLLHEHFMQEDPFTGRREMALSTLKMIAAHPWTGTGLGTWVLVYPAYAMKDFGAFMNAAHNDWLQWAEEGGVVMIALMGLLFVSALRIASRVTWALGIPMAFLHSLIDFPMQGRFSLLFYFLVFGAAARVAVDSGTRERAPAFQPSKASRPGGAFA